MTSVEFEFTDPYLLARIEPFAAISYLAAITLEDRFWRCDRPARRTPNRTRLRVSARRRRSTS